MSYLPDIHRLLPQSPYAEQGILCSIILSPFESLAICDDAGVDSDWFHIPAHAEVWRALRAILDSPNAQLDFIRLTSYLRDAEKLDAVGGVGFISSLWTFLPTAANLDYYVGIAAEKRRLRLMIAIGTEFASRSYHEQDRADELAAEFEAKVLTLSEGKAGRAEQSNKQLVHEVIKDVQTLYENKGKITGIETGFTEYDKLTNGLHPEELTIFAARPSVGKTACALAITEHVIFRLGIPVIFVSLEMSPKQLMARLLYSLARLNAQRVRDGLMTERDFPALMNAGKDLAESLVKIIDTGETGGTIQKIRSKTRAKVRELRKAGHEKVVFIGDYLQLMGSSGKKAGNREQEVAEVSRGLKLMSKELQIPVVVLAQINRSSVKEKRRPRPSDLRESGSIEQDADNVCFIIRPEMDCEHDDPELENLRGKAEIDIAKQRNGPCMETVHLRYVKEFARFENPQT
jgi:replicative DNA helicase